MVQTILFNNEYHENEVHRGPRVSLISSSIRLCLCPSSPVKLNHIEACIDINSPVCWSGFYLVQINTG